MSLASRRELANADVVAFLADQFQPGEQIMARAVVSSRGLQLRKDDNPAFPRGHMMQAVLTTRRILVVSQKSFRGGRSFLGAVEASALAGVKFRKTRLTEVVDRIELRFMDGTAVELETPKKGSGAEDFVDALGLLIASF